MSDFDREAPWAELLMGASSFFRPSLVRMKFDRVYVLIVPVLLVILCHAARSNAQQATDSISVPAEHFSQMWSLNPGYGFVTHEETIREIAAECDVPFEPGYFCVGLRYVDGPTDFSYGVDLLWKRRIATIGATRIFAAAGGEFLVWTSRANAGIPLNITAAIPLVERVSLDLGLRYTTLFFLGGEPGRGLFGLFTGIHFTAP